MRLVIFVLEQYLTVFGWRRLMNDTSLCVFTDRMALSRTPLAPDPGYEHTCNFYPRGAPADPAPRGRVRPEAVDIARLHTKGSIELLLQLQGEPSHRRFKRM